MQNKDLDGSIETAVINISLNVLDQCRRQPLMFVKILIIFIDSDFWWTLASWKKPYPAICLVDLLRGFFNLPLIECVGCWAREWWNIWIKKWQDLREDSLEYKTIAGTYVGTELTFIPVETFCCATVRSYMSYAKDLNILGDFETIVLLVLLEGKLVLCSWPHWRVVCGTAAAWPDHEGNPGLETHVFSTVVPLLQSKVVVPFHTLVL